MPLADLSRWDTEDRGQRDCPTLPVFLGTLTQAGVVIAASLISGRLSDRTGRRKIFVLTAAIVYALALFVVAIASNFNGFLVGLAISGLGFGMYAAVDLALVADVLPDKNDVAKDLGVFNIAGALPSAIAPAIAAGHPGPRQRQLRRAVYPSPEHAPSSEPSR